MARAEPEPEPDDPIEITVLGKRLSAANEALHQELRERGYLRVVRFGQRSFYFHPQLWKPNVMIHREGFARVHGVRLLPVGLGPAPKGKGANPPDWRYEPKTPDFYDSDTVTWQSTFATQSRRAARSQAETLASHLSVPLQEVRDARWALAQVERSVMLRDELVRIWFDGVDVDGVVLPDAPSRRAALARRWADTAEGVAGEWAREIVVAFVNAEVQPSAPFEPAEIAQVNQRHDAWFSPAR